ncbi:fungal-specific transcription factor domain-containing protein [Pyrenochaeta sp. MPI-SDFR-AT-0127]|nr:fungal-specific transcription factor domain-containing protein [Pyrenochaeta sp. MPI-SDFR-AT-0127]
MASLTVPPTPAKKERGCFQCSRRRIICDKGQPSCTKCINKGIECSGLGRIRFAKGVARRGRLKDCKIPDANSNGLQEGNDVLPTEISFQALRWPNEKRPKQRRTIEAVKDLAVICPENSFSLEGETTMMDESIVLSSQVTSPDLASTMTVIQKQDDDDVEEVVRGDMVLNKAYSRSDNIISWVAPIGAEARMLFSYFSEAVAPVMVILDDNSNGYRSLILPMAFEDDVLRRAVRVVAAQHLSRERPELKDEAEAERTAIISSLRRNALGCSADKVFNKFTWATVIVLLVGETVTGSADYRFLVQMLLCLSMNGLSDDVDPALMSFLQAQAHMFEMLGVPLLGEEVGVLTVMKASDSLTDWLSYPHLPDDSDDRRAAETIRQCFISACAIYTRRAASANTSSYFGFSDDVIQKLAIEQLISNISRISPSARGAHALVWVCFVAGAEATEQAHREFFVQRMKQTYAQTQFRNIPAAIESLEKIWSRKNGERWTLCLPQFSNVLVM